MLRVNKKQKPKNIIVTELIAYLFSKGPSLSCPTDLSPLGSDRSAMTSKSLRGVPFPKSQCDRRSFQSNWLDKYKWLDYSALSDAAFCFVCRLFNVNGVNEEAFTGRFQKT